MGYLQSIFDLKTSIWFRVSVIYLNIQINFSAESRKQYVLPNN